MKATWMILCALLALPAGAASAADSPWNGTWKLDSAKSQLTGQTFSYTQRPNGMLHYEDGSTTSYDFGLDGKEYKTWTNRTSTWTAAGNNAWDRVVRIDGKVTAKGHIVLSADGKTLTETYTGTRPDGQEFHEEDVYSRMSGTDGLAGTWRAAKVTGPTGPQTFIISSPAAGVLRYEIPDMKVSVEAHLDGTEYAVSGPEVPPGMTISFKRISAKSIRYTMKVNGKTDNMGVQTIARDGGSFRDVNWNAQRENEKTTAVYVKQ
ncbi:MAG TPA: hypothetical protein VGR80_09600 [Steroidobacteraceae bacterium]|nr:hypothetical protein [Steroidobacteraceae bacterium]